MPPSTTLQAPPPDPVPPSDNQDVPGGAASAPFPDDSELLVHPPPVPPVTLTPSESAAEEEESSPEVTSSGISGGTLAGIIVGAILGLLLLLCLMGLLLKQKGCLRKMRSPRYAYYPQGNAMTRHEWRRKGAHEAYVSARARIPPHRMDHLLNWQHNHNISFTSGGSMDYHDAPPQSMGLGSSSYGSVHAGMGPQVPLPSHPHHSATLNGVNGMRSNPLFSHEDTSGLPWQARAHNHHNRAARTEAPGVGDKTQHSTTRQGAGAAQSHGVDELLVTLQQLLKDVAAQSESAVRLQAPPGAAAGAGMVAASGSNHPGTHTSAVGRARSTSGRAQGQGLNRAPPSLEQAPHELPAFPPFQGPQQSPLLIATHSGFPDYYQHHHNDVQDLQHHNRFTEPHSGFHGNGAQPIGPGPGPPSHLQLPPAAVAWSPVSASVPTTGASSAPAAYLAPPLGQGSLAAAWQENAASISPSPSMFPSHAAAPASFPLPAAPPLQSMHESPAYISLEPYYPASDPFLHASPASQAYPNQ